MGCGCWDDFSDCQSYAIKFLLFHQQYSRSKRCLFFHLFNENNVFDIPAAMITQYSTKLLLDQYPFRSSIRTCSLSNFARVIILLWTFVSDSLSLQIILRSLHHHEKNYQLLQSGYDKILRPNLFFLRLLGVSEVKEMTISYQ